jgi:hypothetical protein
MRMKYLCALFFIFAFLNVSQSFAGTADLNIAFNTTSQNTDKVEQAVRAQLAAIMKLGTGAGIQNFYLTHIGFGVSPQQGSYSGPFVINGYVILAFTPEQKITSYMKSLNDAGYRAEIPIHCGGR